MNENIDLTKIFKDCPKGTKLIDLSNQRFGKWTVLHRFDNPNKHDKRTLWTCKCECGNIRNIDSYTLRSGSSKVVVVQRMGIARQDYTLYGLV